MSTKSSSRELIWIVTGVLALLVAFFTVLYLRVDRDPVAQFAFKEKCVAQINAMRLSLAAASEAQNSTVMSTGEQDSKKFAEESRVATTGLESGRIELEQLLKVHAGPHETELMDKVSQSLREFHQVDEQLLDLAIQNSNRKAFGLAFGPATKLLNEVDEPLAKIVANTTNLPLENRVRIVQLASEARVGVLRMQVLLLPHIAEASDQKMDEFELQLSDIDRKVRENFAELSPLLSESEKPNIDTVLSRYGEFENLKSQIIKLSRQNTDLRAVEIALKEKRKAMLACQDALVALEHAIQTKPINSTIPSGRTP